MEKPFVSVIVPVRNAERTILTTFEYLMNIDYPRTCLEIIFADGGSTDSTVGIIKKYKSENNFIKLVEVPDCPSPGFARTQALKKADGEFIFFTDGDCAPCRDWIDQMIKVFQKDPKIGAVGGEIFTLRVDPDNLVEIFCEAFGFNRVGWRYGNLQESYYPDQGKMPLEVCGHKSYFFVTANVAYRKEVVDQNNREFWALPTGEDMDFGIRARQNDWKFYFLPSASVDHMHRADEKALLRVWESYGAAHPPLLKAHAKNFLEIVFQFIGQWPKHPSIKIPSAVKGFIYIGNFHLMHMYGILFLISFLLQWLLPESMFLRVSSWVCLFPTLWCTFHFFKTAFNIPPYWEWPAFAKMKYLTNLKFILGGLKGSKKNKTICVEPSF